MNSETKRTFCKLTMSCVTFDYSKKPLRAEFDMIEEQAWACGIKLVSRRMDPVKWIEVYDSYIERLRSLLRELWSRLDAGDEVGESGGERAKFIPRRVLEEHFFRHAVPEASGKITTSQLEAIHDLAERAMGGFITMAANLHPQHQLHSEYMGSCHESLDVLVKACPPYLKKRKPLETNFLVYGGERLRIVCKSGHVIYAELYLDSEKLKECLHSLLGVDPKVGVTRENLGMVWSDDFRGFEACGFEVRVTRDKVKWLLGDTVIKTPNNENFKYFVANFAL